MNWYKIAQGVGYEGQYTDNSVKHNPHATPEHYKDNQTVEGEYTLKLWDAWHEGDYKKFADIIEAYRQNTLKTYQQINPENFTPRQISDYIQNRINVMTSSSTRKTRPIVENFGELNSLNGKSKNTQPDTNNSQQKLETVDSLSGGQIDIPF